MRFFKIREANDIKNFYVFEKINKIIIKEIYLENRLKRYINRKKNYQSIVEIKNENNKIKSKLIKEIKFLRSNSSNNRESIAIIILSLSNYNYYNYIEI